MRSLICVSASTTVQSLDSLYFYRKTLHTECGCSALANSKLEIHWVLCAFIIYIKRFLRIDVCAMQECSMHVCECIHFRLDLLEGFFCQSFILLCCSYARMIDTVLYHCYFYYTDEIFMSIASNITFFPSIHSVYISFKLRPIMPDRNCYWVLSFGFILKIYSLNSFKRQIFHLTAIFFFILSYFRSKNQNTWFKSNCMIIFYYVFNRKSVKIQWTLDINHLPQLSIMGILSRHQFGYSQYDIRRPISNLKMRSEPSGTHSLRVDCHSSNGMVIVSNTY